MLTLRSLFGYALKHLPRVEPLSHTALAPVKGQRRRVFAGRVIVTHSRGD